MTTTLQSDSSYLTVSDFSSEDENDSINVSLEEFRQHVSQFSLITDSAKPKSTISDLLSDIHEQGSWLHLQTIAAFKASQHDIDSISASTDINTLTKKVKSFKRSALNITKATPA